jgi:hypothetical protein
MAKKASKGIQMTAAHYQKIQRQKKELEAQEKPLKEELLQYSKEHPELYDDANQIKFDCGAYVALRVSDKLEADDAAKQLLMDNLDDEYIDVKLNEKAIVQAALGNDRFRKKLTAAGAGIAQKEILAVYAN